MGFMVYLFMFNVVKCSLLGCSSLHFETRFKDWTKAPKPKQSFQEINTKQFTEKVLF